MGCGSSQNEVGPSGAQTPRHPPPNTHSSRANGHVGNGHVIRATADDTSPDIQTAAADDDPKPKSIMFEVNFDNPAFRKAPPRKFQLQPLGLPKLTADQLAEKQRVAEAKREQQRKKRVKSASVTSRRRRDLIAAKQFSATQAEQEFQSKGEAAEQKREAQLELVREKQRKREERARRAKDRARRQKQDEEEGLQLDLERDRTFNHDDDDADSWLGDGDQYHKGGTRAVRSPLKSERSGEPGPKPRPLNSASTLDSCDMAFSRQRKPRGAGHDDFFDS